MDFVRLDEVIHGRLSRDYLVVAFTRCIRCDAMVVLGERTLGAVRSGAVPLCLDCAHELAAQDVTDPP